MGQEMGGKGVAKGREVGWDGTGWGGPVWARKVRVGMESLARFIQAVAQKHPADERKPLHDRSELVRISCEVAHFKSPAYSREGGKGSVSPARVHWSMVWCAEPAET